MGGWGIVAEVMTYRENPTIEVGQTREGLNYPGWMDLSLSLLINH